jgi:hypothetical protein
MNKLVIASAIFLLAVLCQANPVDVEQPQQTRNATADQSSGLIDGLLVMLREREARHIGHHHPHNSESSGHR